MSGLLAPLQYHASVKGGFQAIDISGTGAGPWAYTYSLIDKSGNLIAINADGSINATIVSGGGGANIGATGAPVPASANFDGINVGGNLQGVTGAHLGSQFAVSVQIVDASGNQITSFGSTTSNAPVTPAAATATTSLLLGMQFNSVQATFTNAQQGSIQGSSRGAPFVTTGADGFPVAGKWKAGVVGLIWTAAFTASTLNSIVSGNAIISDLALDNSTNLDLFCDVSVIIGSVTSGAGAPYIGVYLYPLNSDGSTYGDGRFGSSAAGPPPSQYFVGSIPLVPSVTQAQEGTLRGVLLPPGGFKFVFYNLAGVTLAGAGANTCKYRTYNSGST